MLLIQTVFRILLDALETDIGSIESITESIDTRVELLEASKCNTKH